ncbi:LD-carboxypeptidase [Luteibacter sahnii]|uniref:LD-carboxypeptidase n=1 Tax=Luteibacter sahnii TaxID=3021977 RepID=UPI002A756D7D|nr:LD-carboxypeptidase [Luteibacter sp. PPL193]MDY1550085.1 LD-carboxypeptidase [Luteibacter sp. PPL193]
MPKRLDIRLIAPSGYVSDRAACLRGIERLQAAGHTLHGLDVVERVHLRFAGTDAERLDDINRLADPAQPLPDVAMAICGGFGANVLLGDIDYAGLAARFHDAACRFVGHGDFTAIQCALYAKAGIASLHGPMLVQDFGGTYLRERTWRQFWQTLDDPRIDMSWACLEPQPDLLVEGTLWGGNLSSLCSLLGTPYLPRIHDGLLYIEETGEQAYKIERMLYELKLSGVLDGQRAILVGGMGGQRVSEYDNGYDIDHALERFRRVCGVPMLRGLVFGHGPDKWTLPFGSPGVLEVVGGTATLSALSRPYAPVKAAAPLPL